MQVSGHDIRMKEFRRAIVRGYSTDDVDTFLMHLAVDIDERDREIHEILEADTAVPETPVAVAPAAVEPEPAQDEEALARSIFDDIIDQARTAALEIRAEARMSAVAIGDDAQRAADDSIAKAKATAQRGLSKARERAEEIITAARDHEESAARLHAEAQLRLAHVEQQLSARADALAAEARRLDELAGWLAEHDLAPAEPADLGHQPSHAAPDVVAFNRAADGTSAEYN